MAGPAIYITLLFVDTDGYKFCILDEFANCGHSSTVSPSSAPKIDISNSFFPRLQEETGVLKNFMHFVYPLTVAGVQ